MKQNTITTNRKLNRGRYLKEAALANESYLLAQRAYLNNDPNNIKLIDEFFERIKGKMINYAGRATRCRTWQDDIIQESKRRIIMGFDKYSPERGKPMQLVVTIIANTTRDWIALRQKTLKRKKDLDDVLDGLAPWYESPEEQRFGTFYEDIDEDLGLMEQTDVEAIKDTKQTKKGKDRQEKPIKDPRPTRAAFIT